MSIGIPFVCTSYTCPSLERIGICLQKVAGALLSIPLLPLAIINALGQYNECDIFAWQRRLFTPISPFPKEFLEELEKYNQGKTGDVPLALILHSQADSNGAFSSPASWHLFLQIAKTHKVVLKMIDTGWFWGRKIRETAEEEGRAIDLLYVAAHGHENYMQFGEFGLWNAHPAFRIANLSASDFSPLAKDATIILDSCDTGKHLASLMAILSKHTVLAPKKEIDAAQSVFCNPHLLVYEEGKQQMHAFLPDGSSQVLEGDRESCHPLFQEKLEYLKKAVETGSAAAQSALARILHLGGMVERSDPDAAHWYRLAAEQGHPQSQYMMGVFYKDGLGGISQSDEEALSWFRRAAEQGHKRACSMLGVFYSEGRGGSVCSDQESLAWFRRAAELGDRPAQFKMGQLYLNGKCGLSQSEKDAFHWFSLAAEQGYSPAQYVVGCMYRLGYEWLKQSDEIALQWFQKAADRGLAEAQFTVGLAYQHGRYGIEKSEVEALRWFRLAADQGDADAQNKVGVFYHWGRGGLSQSFAEALPWYRLAAEQGDSTAQFNLGFLYEHGLGGLVASDEEALSLYRLAADQGANISRFMMSRFYEQGRGGLEPSVELAQEWFEKIPESRREEIHQEIEGLKAHIQSSLKSNHAIG